MDNAVDAARVKEFMAISRLYSDSSIIMHEAIAHKAGLSGADHKYLGLLMQKGKMTAGELSKLSGLTTGAVTGLIDRLEKKKLVQRQLDPEDRRKVIIVPDMARALKLLTPVFAELQQKTEALVSSLSKDELQIIERYFISAVDIMNEVTNKLNQNE
ncbi:MAG TPA: MarR family transcriptional regulator [Cytophagales bacterium]|nr:MarR family transcriptional regulator [Cytophagales bacterium]